MCDSEGRGTIGGCPKTQRLSCDGTDALVPPPESDGSGEEARNSTASAEEMTGEAISPAEPPKENDTTKEEDQELRGATQEDSESEDVTQDNQKVNGASHDDPSPEDKIQNDPDSNEGTEDLRLSNREEEDEKLQEELEIEHSLGDSGTQESVDLVDGVHRNLKVSPDSTKEKPSEEEEGKKLENDPELEKSIQDTPGRDEALETVTVSTGTQQESPRVSQGERESRESCEGGMRVFSSSSGQGDGTSGDGEAEEGVDPFSAAPETAAAPPSRAPKSVNFKEDPPTENGGSPRSSSVPHHAHRGDEEKEEEEEEEEEEEKKEDKKPSRHKALGEGNPVYRLSMKLSPHLFNMMDIPGASQHVEAEKAGYLSKLSGRSFPYIPQWKRRYCVLSKGRLYYYEREDSRQGEKANGVINLEYFDQVTEAAPKDCKKATNVFVITSQDRSFFDPGRHLFSADTLPDMKDWIRRLQAALELIRNNNRRPATAAAATVTSTSTASSMSAGKESGKKRKEESSSSVAETREDRETHTTTSSTTTKDRKKKKEDSQRPRKSARTGVSSETQTSMADAACEQEATTGAQNMATSPKGGIQLPGLSAHKAKPAVKDDKPAQKSAAVTRPHEASEDLPQAGPTLTCVTKLRVKGPQGRRAPQSQRRTVALKQRASSLSALEHQEGGDNREAPWMNRSLDVLEAGQPPIPRVPLAYKAYNYSSDEDDFDDDHSDSFPTSAAGMPPPPPPPPRSASYGLDMRPSCPPVGRLALHHSLGEDQGSHDNLTGSKHSLGEWGGGPEAGWGGSRGSLGLNGEVSGGASPVMDDLDNLLMNQSLQHSAPPHEHHLSDETSEGSTFRAAHQPHTLHHHHHHQHHHHQPQESRKKSQHQSRFAAAVRHLQKHVVEIDQAVLAMTGEVGGTRQEVATLKEAVSALQADTHTITTTLSSLTQQAITVQHKITQATQEAEHVQQIAAVALKEAEQARQEQLRVRQEYEALVGEVRSTLHFLKESHINRKDYHATSKDSHPLGKDIQVAEKPSHTVEKDSKGTGRDPKSDPSATEEGDRSGTSFVASLGGSRGSGGSWTGPVIVTKSASLPQREKAVPAYQSLFSRSSSIISGLTSRHSLTKSVSFADQKNKRKSDGGEGKSSILEKWKEDKSTSPKESTSKDEKSLISLDKREKESKRQTSLEVQAKRDKHQRSLERKQKDGKHGKAWGSKQDQRDAVISRLSDDDIPMADDTTHEVLKAAPTKISTSKLTLNFSLGKSSSTPTVSYVSAANIPSTMQMSRDRQSSELSISNASLDSPTASGPYPRPGSGILPPVEESPPASEAEAPSGPLLHRPGSTPGPLTRQGSMTTVPEDRVVSGPPTTKRSGVFAISRQHSSPNIPLQRQGSSSMFPLQRQGSLGVVPESRLPRQESLTSVPEDRVVVDRTLPLSPSPSMTYVPLSPSASSSVMSESARQAARESMELVTGPVLAGSSIQEAAATGTLPVLCLAEEQEPPAATSSLKKDHKQSSNVVGILV